MQPSHHSISVLWAPLCEALRIGLPSAFTSSFLALRTDWHSKEFLTHCGELEIQPRGACSVFQQFVAGLEAGGWGVAPALP